MGHSSIGFAAGPLPTFGPIFARWLHLQQRYLDRCELCDATWIYNERASLSVLAASAWGAGGIALEEFSAEKRAASRRGSKASVNTNAYGRCDLFVSIRNQDFLIEAKPSWPSLRSEAKLRISEALSAAVRDVRRNSAYRGAKRLGAVLIAPHVPRSDVKNSGALVEAFLQDLASMEGCAAAWFFPKSTRTFLVTTDGNSYPGAAILMKPLRRAG